jgi:type VII secretion-associated serine protease mycosin
VVTAVRASRIRHGAALAAILIAALPALATAAYASPAIPEWWFTAWNVETQIWPHTQGAGVTVAVVDTGVSANPPELRQAVLPGYDATGASPDGRHDTDAKGSHGTTIAPLIAAQGGGAGIRGIAPRARILPVIIGLGTGQVDTNQVAAAIRWAADHGARVINASFGAADTSPAHCPPLVQDAIRHAILDKDVVVVASAGNSGNTTNNAEYPASCPGVLAVGAVDRQAHPWTKSQRQPYVGVAAPGVNIVSVNQHDQLIAGNGTSYASALTAAAAALIRAAHPDLTARQTVARLLATPRDPPAPGSRDPQRGYGTIRLDKAINDPIPTNAPNPIYDALTPPPPSPRPGTEGTTIAGKTPHLRTTHTRLAITALLIGAAFIATAAALSTTRRRHRATPR